ncbi:MAG: hypothetical protein ACP5OU_00325 [Methanothrix sp.]
MSADEILDDILDDMLDASLDELQKFVKLLGEPIDLEDKIIIPLVEMTLSFAGRRGGAGFVAGLHPFAALALCKSQDGPDGVKALPIPPRQLSVSAVSQAVMEGAILREEDGARIV